jgi:hypothetical protein
MINIFDEADVEVSCEVGNSIKSNGFWKKILQIIKTAF